MPRRHAAMLAAAALLAAPCGAGHAPCWPYDTCPPFPTPYAQGTYPTSYSYDGTFPDDFIWGLGTAAYQIEGAYRDGGRGASIWDTYVGADTTGMPGARCTAAPCPVNPNMFAKGATGNVANDHYHRFKDDVAMMKAWGLQNYRFSIAWPRIFPSGNSSEGVNEEGVAFYNALINELVAAGITPIVTLFHWDLPQGLLSPSEGKYGWWSDPAAPLTPNPMIVEQFTAFADVCFQRFGDRVKYWFTFNEAWTFTWLASGSGKAPSEDPYMDMQVWPYVAGHNVLLAHAHAAQVYRTKYQAAQKGRIGMTNNIDWREPKTTSQADVAAGERAAEFWLAWFSDPVWTGDYPPSMRAIVGDRLPKFTAAEKQMLNGSADFFGLNHYGTGWVVDNQNDAGWNQCYADTTEDGFPRAQSSWLYGAGWGLRKLLNWINRRYPQLAARGAPIYLTEGGWSLDAKGVSDGVKDSARTYYYANYTSEVLRTIRDDGVNVGGYFAWSLMDNFEWERGYTERFGVTYNDFGYGADPRSPPGGGCGDPPPASGNCGMPTTRQTRTRKDSSRWLEKVWRSNKLVDPASMLR